MDIDDQGAADDISLHVSRLDLGPGQTKVVETFDALEFIFRFVDGFHLAMCMQVCQIWQTVGMDEKLWSTLCAAEQVPVLGPKPTWFRTYSDFSAGSWRFVTSEESRTALRAALPLLHASAKPTSLFSWAPMQEPRYWQWGDWCICNLNEVVYIMSTIGCSQEAPIPWLVVEIVGNSNGWYRFTEKRVPVGHLVNVSWEVADIDDNQQPFEKAVCGSTVRFDAPFLPCGLYRSGIPQYTWDILVRPRQLFVISSDGILEFRKHAMGFLASDRTGTMLFPRQGRASASSLSTWLMSQPAEGGDNTMEEDEDDSMDDGLDMEW